MKSKLKFDAPLPLCSASPISMASPNQNRPPRSPSTKKVAAEEIASNKSPIIRIGAEKGGTRLPSSAVLNNNSDVDSSTLEFTTKQEKHTHPAAKSANIISQKKPPIPKSTSMLTKKGVQRGSNLASTKQRFSEKNGFVAMTRRLFEEPNDSTAEAEKEISIHQTKKASMASLDIDHLGYKMHDNALYEAENSPPDARDNVKLRMMEENHDSSMEKGISEVPEEKHTLCFSNHSKALSTVGEGHKVNEENNLNKNENGSPPISSQLCDRQSLCSTTTLCKQIPEARSISVDDQVSTEIAECVSLDQISTEVAEPRTPNKDEVDVEGEFLKTYLFVMNSAGKDGLKLLNGIGDVKAAAILDFREKSPSRAPFKSLDDLKSIGILTKPFEGLMKKKK